MHNTLCDTYLLKFFEELDAMRSDREAAVMVTKRVHQHNVYDTSLRIYPGRSITSLFKGMLGSTVVTNVTGNKQWMQLISRIPGLIVCALSPIGYENYRSKVQITTKTLRPTAFDSLWGDLIAAEDCAIAMLNGNPIYDMRPTGLSLSAVIRYLRRY